MDTRQAIQSAPEPAVLSIAFSEDGLRFVCGMVNGIRAFQSKDCIRTIKEAPGSSQGIGVSAVFDDKYLAFVGGGRTHSSSPNKVEFWDNVAAQKVHELDFAEPILGIRMTSKLFVIILLERAVTFEYGTLPESGLVGPANVLALYDTAPNPYALCCARSGKTVLPGLTAGQVQVVALGGSSKKIVRAHSSELRQLDLSVNGEVLATASKQGTLIRVFSTSTLSQTHEFRRGVDAAIIYSLSISPSNQFVATTSDKGTLHVFDLRQPPAREGGTERTAAQRHRPSVSRPMAVTHNRPLSTDFDALSLPSAASAPHTVGGFYDPPSDLAHTPPANAPSALSALARIPGMPRAFSDARSMTSISYHLGSDPPNWQGQPAHVTTTLPNGQRINVNNPNVPIAGLPDGRPPKGILVWDSESPDRRLWCVGGGADARWEVFELADTGQGPHRLCILKIGFRKYLTRQFPAGEM